MVSLVRLMLFTTTVEILTVRTGSVQSCHQTPIFPYRGRARQTRGDAHTLKESSSTTKVCTVFNVLAPSLSVVSPASLLDSQHGCIASPHAKKESGQTP